jgi:dienelactone hydrolase
MKKTVWNFHIHKKQVLILIVFLFITGLSGCPGNNTYYYSGDSNPYHTLLLKSPTTGTAPYPAIVFIHGGNWGEPSFQKSYFNNGIDYAAKNEFVGVSINYHLTSLDPSVVDHKPWPDQLIDAKNAVSWLRKNAAVFKIDPERIYVLGQSAGGQIALMMALTNSTLSNPYYKFDRSSDVQGVCSVGAPNHLLSLYNKTSLSNPDDIFNALIEYDPVVHSANTPCKDMPCLYIYEGRCINLNGYCDNGVNYEDLSTMGYTLAEASPLQNLMMLPKKPDGTKGHVPILMVYGKTDDTIPPDYNHRPFYNLLDNSSKAEASYYCGHLFTGKWDISGGIYETAFQFFGL